MTTPDTTWQNYFSGNPVKTPFAQYEALSISATTALYWPTETLEGVLYVAAQIDVTATATGLQLQMPPASEGSTGVATIITNVGTNALTLTDTSGNPIVTLNASVSWIISLIDNSTTNGTWRAYQLAATTSSAQASQLAGAGLQANGSLLQLNFPTQSLSANQNIDTTFRANAVVWTGATGTLTLNAPSGLGAGWWAMFSNEGTGVLTINTASGTINGQASIALPVGTTGQFYSGIVVCTGTAFNVFGYVPVPIPITGGGTGAQTANAALTNFGGSSIGITIFTAPSAAAVIAALGLNTSVFTENTVSSNQVLSSGSSGTVFVNTTPITLVLPQASTLTKSYFFAAYAQGGAITVQPNAVDSIDGATAGTAYIVPDDSSAMFVTDAGSPNGNWYPVFASGGGQESTGLWAVAGGTADVITAAYAPAIISLVDGLILGFRASAPNTSTTPTFSPNGLTAYNITKWGGTPLVPGDIPAQYAECLVRYNLANTRWELLNPAYSESDVTAGGTLASATTTDLGTIAGHNVTISGTTTITSFGSSANVNSPLYFLTFSGALTLTYNSVSMVLPGYQSIATQPGDTAVAQYLGSGNWIIWSYARATGNPLAGTTGAAATIASATTTDLGTLSSNVATVTGSTTINSFGSSALTTNPLYFLTFSGSLTLTYNSSSMILPGLQNAVTNPGDTAVAQYLGSGNWKIVQYTLAANVPGGSAVLQSGTISSASEASIDFNTAVKACSVVKVVLYNIALATDNVTVQMRLRTSATDLTTGYSWTNVSTYPGSGPIGTDSNAGTATFITVATTAASFANGFPDTYEVTLYPESGSATGTGLFSGTHSTGSANYDVLQVIGTFTLGGASGLISGLSLYASSGNIALSYQITGH